MQKTYSIKTFGCAMNHSDSERISTFLEKNGFIVEEKSDLADIIIFNTCGIKQGPENRIYSLINNIRKKDKVCMIILTGCLALRKDVQKRLKGKVDLFTEIKDFPAKMSTKLFNAENNQEHLNQESINYLSINPKHTNDFQAYVPIMTGCDNFCTYCVVPYARGREVSRSADEIISEVKSLIKKGYKSITLLGQNVNSYHGALSMKHEARNKKTELNFTQLLKKINAIPGDFWILFVSSHPKDMSDELIETVTKLKKVCEWIHLPVQAGNNKILEKMNRKYTREHYLERLKKIKIEFKKNKPENIFSISSDIIVGFPGETKKQFMDSAELMKKAKFDMVFFGQFSPRPETVAWKMKDDVEREEKIRRENFLNDILKKTALANNKKYLNQNLKVLIEKEKNGTYFGKTRTQKNVMLVSEKKNLVGTFVKVKITKANIWNLEGEIA